jgi:hypothetical protein
VFAAPAAFLARSASALALAAAFGRALISQSFRESAERGAFRDFTPLFWAQTLPAKSAQSAQAATQTLIVLESCLLPVWLFGQFKRRRDGVSAAKFSVAGLKSQGGRPGASQPGNSGGFGFQALSLSRLNAGGVSFIRTE